MDKLQLCAKSFENLLNTKYHVVLGRKNKLIHLNIIFSEWDFHHLMGLGKLKDIRLARQNRAVVFDDILNGHVTYKTIANSRYIEKISGRFTPLSQIESILDENNIIFRYNERLNVFSMIQADFLLATPFRESEVYIFLTNKDEDNYCCCSFFPKSTKDYTQGQTKYALLYKAKVNLVTGESTIQYDKLNKKD